MTVSRKPVGQDCTVSQGSGTASADVGNVSVTCAAPAYTVAHTFQFNAFDGDTPMGPPALADDGNLYGTTFYGGERGGGILYQVDSAGQWSLVLSMPANVYGPTGPLVNVNGKLYGTTDQGSTTSVFSYAPGGKLDNLVSVTGRNAPGGVSIGPGSQLVITTSSGATNGYGGIYTIEPSAHTATLRHAFTLAEGSTPSGRLTLGADGKYYLLMFSGGSAECGTILQMDTNWVVTKFKDLAPGSAYGCHPVGTLLKTRDGVLYGMARSGGNFSVGTIFSLDMAGNLTKRYNFVSNYTLGYSPIGSLVEAQDGHLYGVTYLGGTSGQGQLFRFSRLDEYTALHSFLGGSDGAFPQGDLTVGADGHLYGATIAGGTMLTTGDESGVLFRY